MIETHRAPWSKMTDYINSYYTQTLTDSLQRLPLTACVETDVCVIGGGLAGLSTALSLGEQGVDTVVLEANRVGWGGSGRNGGCESWFLGLGATIGRESWAR